MPFFHKELVWHTFLILLAALVFVHVYNSPCMAGVNSKFILRQVDANSQERSGGRFFQPPVPKVGAKKAAKFAGVTVKEWKKHTLDKEKLLRLQNLKKIPDCLLRYPCCQN